MKRRNERQKGFTLIELLVVLIVIAVLAAVLVPALTSYLDDAREKKAVSEAQVCVTAATEWAAVQRTALISQAYQTNKSFADAYNAAGNTAKWSNDYAALNTAAPTVTGTPALAEGDGQYFLRPESTPNDTTDETMKNTVKTAAGVDGKLERMQLNADGKVLYLLYTSAEGIPVAYTAAGTAQTPDTTVLVATLPPDTPTPPEPTEPDHSDDLVFCVKDEYTGKPVKGITFHLVDNKTGSQVSTSQKTDTNGMVYFTIDMSGWGDNDYRTFTLYPEPLPEGYQVVYPVTVEIRADNKFHPFKYFNVQQQNNENQSTGNYKQGYAGKYKPEDAYDHLYTFYVRTVPTLELCVWDDVNDHCLAGVEFTMSMKDHPELEPIAITSGLSPTLLDVKLREGDKTRTGRTVMDISQSMRYSQWIVDFTKVPEGYLYFDDCYLEIKLQNEPEHNDQLYTQFSKGQWFGGKQSNTDIECKNLPDKNKCVVTIHVQGGKEVNFFVYDGLDNEHTTQLPNATMELYDSKNAKIATFTTDKNGNPTDTESFTKNLSEGDYTLKLASKPPKGYTQPTDIPFTITRGTDGLLTIAGTGANASCVDNTNSTVTMLVTKPDTMRFKLQIVDYNNGAKNSDPKWAGVNVKITGDALDATFNDQRAYAIKSQSDNEHTFDITNAKSDKPVTVTIVNGKKEDDGYDIKKHNPTYAENFVRSKFQFKLNKNADGTFTLTPEDNKSARDGYIIGDTVYVYAYPKVTFDYICYPTPASSLVFGQGTLTVVSNPNGNSVYTVFDSKDSTHSTIQPWQMAGNRNHPAGIPLGSYELKNAEYHKWTVFKPDSTAPWYFTVTQDDKGFPVIKDKNGNITKTITAGYTYLPTGS